MEMRAREDIKTGEDLTPPLLPLASTLYNSTLSSHCFACFSPLTPSHFTPRSSHNSNHVLYCSPRCSSLDSPLHFSSSESHLLRQSPPSTCPDSSDLRLSLRLLSLFKSITKDDNCLEMERIEGIMTNRERLLHNEGDDVSQMIKDGATAMMSARRRMRMERDGVLEEKEEELLCTAVLCLVMTNAVEVQDKNGRGIGVAVYDTTFSWINHSCSPHACYRFVSNGGSPRLRVYPAAVGSGGDGDGDGSEVMDEYAHGVIAQGSEGYGPRMIVRSIKAIKKGEEVTITYTDLLQPKETRQSELWLKYRFDCCCKRCNAVPATYVDQTLQEMVSTSNQIVHNQEAIKSLTHHYNDAINEYLSLNSPESCCQKLENLLTHGQIDEQTEQKYVLHPLHHLSLNAYTILSSAYKVQSNDLLDPNSETKAFELMRVSAAYSLMLAGATHHLYISEPSLIVSVANFWTGAGESLLTLARTEMWDLLVKGSSSFSNYECYKCSLLDGFNTAKIHSQEQDLQFENTIKRCFSCIVDITSKLWTFLAQGDSYLRLIKDPINFRWLGTVERCRIFYLDSHCVDTDKDNSESRSEAWEINNTRLDLFQLGIHCLLYGAFLSRICFGEYSHLICNVKDILTLKGVGIMSETLSTCNK